ncbi:scopoletin glucosyltransferase [Trifolium repens]|nr:scopoletin glucosyltransferase [Trifolium repens]
MSQEICILPFFGQGHLLPCFQLCNHLTSSTNFNVTLLISSTLSTSVPSSLLQNPLFHLTLIPSPPPSPEHHHDDLAKGLQNVLSDYHRPTRPVCAIVDVMMSWSNDVFKKLEIPTVAFFTSGACSAAMELAEWKAHPLELRPGEIRFVPGLPEDMPLTYSDLTRRRREPPPPPPPHHGFPPPPGGFGRRRGPPKHGDQPRWLDEVRDTIALMINTCDDLERPFIDYIVNHVGKPVWGVGPLLPEQYWKSFGSVIHDSDFRSNRVSSVTEEEVVQWLDSKPRRSVLYVSFGTEVGPTMEEYMELAQALESCEQPFIWVVQPGSGRPGPHRFGGRPGSGKPEAEEGYFPHGLDKRVGDRGLIISGWAPQLLILSHKSTGGFLSHCGWNSTVEAIGRGVPLLAWPIRGDQFHDAKLVVSHLKVGYMVSDDDLSKRVTKDVIVVGIQRLMCDEEIKNNAEVVSAKFQNGFPRSSVAALYAFKDCINKIVV